MKTQRTQTTRLGQTLAAAGLLAAICAPAFADAPVSKIATLESAMERTGGTLEQVLEFRVVAEIELEDGKIHFIDESIGDDFGIGILEIGRVDLNDFHELEATPLEIYLALAPEGSDIPEALFRSHEVARALNPVLPEAPRDFSTDEGDFQATAHTKAVSYYTWDEDTSTCWNWGTSAGELSGNVAAQIGDPGYSYSTAEYYFRSWSQIPNGGQTTETSVDGGTNFIHNYLTVAQTGWGNERAAAICLTHAELYGGTQWWDCAGNENNSVNLRVRIKGESSTNTWYSSYFSLTDYGQGARYRSQSSQDRNYSIQIRDHSIDSNGCQEQYHAMTRNRNIYSIPSGPGDISGG